MASHRKNTIHPGKGLTLGITLLYLSGLVLLPLTALIVSLSGVSWPALVETVLAERSIAALKITFGLSFLAACINLVLGTVVAWTLVRYRFPGRLVFDALIDFPFALPTAVAGIALAAAYSKNGLIGSWLDSIGIRVAYTPLGILIALIFITFPFVVRTIQPALKDLEPSLEEASLTMGASSFQTFRLVVFPNLFPFLLTSFSLAFARGLGEYGSIVFISGNLPKRTEIVSFLIMAKLEQFDYLGAMSLAGVMLLSSFVLLYGINFLPSLMGRWRRV